MITSCFAKAFEGIYIDIILFVVHKHVYRTIAKLNVYTLSDLIARIGLFLAIFRYVQIPSGIPLNNWLPIAPAYIVYL